MNGINSIRLDVNPERYKSIAARNKVTPVEESKTSTEANKKKQFRTYSSNEFGSRNNQSSHRSELILSDSKYYRANLLNEIVNKMSGLDERTSRGLYVEYYA